MGNPDALAVQIEQAVDAFVSLVENVPDSAWNTVIPAEGMTVAALVHHVGSMLELESAAFLKIAAGQGETGWTSEWLNEFNRQQSVEHAFDSRAESMRILVSGRQMARERIASLTDAELQASGRHMPDEPIRTVAEWVNVCLIDHPAAHLPGIEDILSKRAVHDD